MGGGFAAPPIILANKQQALRMHEKLLDKEEKIATAAAAAAAATAAATPPATAAAATTATTTTGTRKDKTEKVKLGKPSKFAERLRRSFRRGEHRSLEIKRQEPTADELKAKSRRTPPPPTPATGTGTGTSSSSSSSWQNNNLVQLHLPGLGLGGGGHINPALLLDSPDESTPPEYAYQHLSSVATTNSSTSLESNCEQLSELSSSQTSVYYWTGAVVTTTTTDSISSGNVCSMGGEVSTAAQSSSNRSDPASGTNTVAAAAAAAAGALPATATTTTTNTTSRSCSLTSESSSVRLTRLQNFLFKSSNESSRSYLGHSNEGFTASSHNSSSGEWEQLGGGGGGGGGGGNSIGAYGHDFHGSSFPEETTPDETDTLPVESNVVGGNSESAGQYYQYTLTSPNNPFLPEITARTYHSTYAEEQDQLGQGEQLEDDSRSAQLPTPAYSRAGSQESSTYSESGISCPPGPTPSPASSSSSTPGRHRRKLFSLNSPTRLLHHQSPTNTHAPVASSSAPNPATMGESSSKFNSATLVRSLNPFLPATSSSSNTITSPKRAPLKQTAAIVTSPGSITPDLSTKREEFLRATMKICLVVSPPTSKLQLKSKSLTHLDGLDTVVACQHGAATATTTNATAAAIATGTGAGGGAGAITTTTGSMGIAVGTAQGASASLGRQPIVLDKIDSVQICQSHPTTIYTQAPQIVRRTPSLMLSLSPTPIVDITTTSTSTSGCYIAKGASTSPSPCVHSSVSSTLHQYHQTHSHPHPHHQHQHHPTTPQQHQKQQLQLQQQQQQQQQLAPIPSTHSIPFSSSCSSSISKQFQCSTGDAIVASSSLSSSSSVSVSVSSATVKPKKSSFMQRKKPLLTRSEVSSSEFFSVLFCLESTQQSDEEFIPATKGVTLANALSHALRVRNLSFNQITITDNYPTPSFLDAGPSPMTSSLDEQTDVENLAGHHLIITERESSRKTLQKAASFGSRQRPPRLLSSASTEETSESAGAAGKQIKQRWTSIFGIKNPQQSQLCELLNSYAKNGVPQRPDALNFEHPDLANSLAYLQTMDKSWLDFVQNDAMSESEIKIQTAIWELVTTEVYYIHALQTVTDLFLACLEAVQEERLLIDVDQHRLFSNIRSVCEANIKFWTLWLYPMVAHSVITHEPMRCAFFQEGFIAFASIFAPYKIYCAEQSTCQFYCKELNQNNALFTSYLAWCESQKMCNRLRLADIVVRPMQRLTKYSLLLAAIKKHMSDVEEIEAMDVMIHSVENFVGSVNNHLTMRQENERLKGVMARIESYDVVDTNNEVLDKLIKQHSQMFDLCAPMRGCPAYPVRHLFMEGDHKFKDNLGKSDVHCFLLTDLLLVCKTIAKKGLGALKVIRQPYLTDQLIVHLAPNNTLNCVYLNEFQVATTAFTLQCTEAKNWYDALWRAKTIYQRLKRGSGGGSAGGNVSDSFRFGGSATSGGTADSLGVRKSPMNSSICSHVSSANNSHSGSVEWNDSRNISVDFEKTNSVSSDEGSSIMTGNHGLVLKGKQQLIGGLHKVKVGTIASTSANTLSVQPVNHLGQSLPNLNMHHSHTNLYHTYSNNTLLVPGTTTSHSGNLLLSPSHRGISYPPPSPTRVPLRRGMAFSTSTKNPPLRKTRNVTSQNSINWHQIPATPTPPSPRSQHQSPSSSTGCTGITLQKSMPMLDNANIGPPILQKQLSHQTPLPTSNHNLMELQRPLSNETDV